MTGKIIRGNKWHVYLATYNKNTVEEKYTYYHKANVTKRSKGVQSFIVYLEYQLY